MPYFPARRCAAILRLTAGILLVSGLTAAPAAAQGLEIINCIVQPRETVRLGVAARGVIARLHVDRADPVRKGMVLAELEASAEESELAMARLRFANDVAARLAKVRAETAEINAERLTQLGDRNLVKMAEQEQAVLEARSARLEEEEAALAAQIAGVQLTAAEAALERRRIRAPFDGVVLQRLMSVGELYNEQGPVLVVATIDPLHVEAWLPATARAQVSPGGLWQVRLDSGQEVQARVDVADPVLDPATGTFGMRLVLPNPDGTILAGQSCRLTPLP